MTPEQWSEIKAVFEQVAELPGAEQRQQVEMRAADASVRAEVIRLLDANARAERFLDTPAARLGDYLAPESAKPALEVGDLVAGRFTILRFLARGGMGEVYEAWDAQLNEAVALKTVRREIASEADAIERFKREVRHAREISHPNICRIHELFAHDTDAGERIWLLCMELLPGCTLLERIRRDGSLSPALALEIAGQLVSGLQAAHAAGLVHRDFKTSNVMLVTGENARCRAVITDFGLSLRMLEPEGGLAEPAGMGTPGYMAPEQMERGEVGPLADQYALGAVLCEMVTGSLPRRSRRPNRHETLLMPVQRLPPRWEGVVSRCMQTLPEDRFASIGDAWQALAPPRRPFAWLLAAVVLVAALGSALLLSHRGAEPCHICNLVQLTPDTDESESPGIASDGRAVVYSSDRADSGNLDIFLQRLPGGRPLRLTRHPARDGDPSISPDGSAIVFRSERDGGGIYLTGAHGGPERLLVPRGRNPQISPDGKRVLYWSGDPDPGLASGRLFVLPLGGGEPTQLAATFADARYPVWSPDGAAVIFSGCDTPATTLPGCSEWWIASLDGRRLVNTGAMQRIRAMGLAVQPGVGFWYERGLVFSGGIGGLRTNLWTIALDPNSWTVSSDPAQLLDENARDLSPTLAKNGAIAYTRLTGALHVWRAERASHPGHAILSKITEDTEIDGSPWISPAGRWLVFERGRGSERGIWIRDKQTGSESLILQPGVPTQSPIVDQTGTLLVYEQIEEQIGGGTSIYVKQRGAPPRRLCQGCSMPTGWYEPSHSFFYRDGVPSAIKMADPLTGATHVVLEEKGASLGDATWSPVSQLMLFTETRGDRKQIFAVRVPAGSAGAAGSGEAEGSWVPIPVAGSSPEHPQWSGDGRTIFFISNGDGFHCIYAQPFSLEQQRPRGAPFAVAHFHNQRASIDNVFPRAFNLSAEGDSLYFNLGEQSSTIWTGMLAGHGPEPAQK